MQTISKRSLVVSVSLLLAVAAAALFAMYQPNVQAAATAQAEVQIDIVVLGQTPEKVIATIAKIDPATSGFVVDSFFDISYAANIGSSGQDGVTATSFTVDSFFDVTYELRSDGDDTGRWDTEMVSLSLRGPLADPSDPMAVANALSAARSAIEAGGDGTGPEYMAKGTVKFFNESKGF